MRILAVAYACEPDCGSEPEVGWQWTQQLARGHEVWVVTRANNREKIERSNIAERMPQLHFEYCDLPSWACFWKKYGMGIHVYYFLWQVLALRRAIRLRKEVKFDIAHHLTFSPMYSPPLICLLPVPFIWGPIGAGEAIPRQYFPLFTRAQRIRERVRWLIRVASRYNPLICYAFSKAVLIVAATSETKSAVPRRYWDKVFVEPQIGMDLSDASTRCDLRFSGTGNDCFRIITAGRHVYWKGHIIVIRAFAEFLKQTGLSSELIVLSDGPEREKLEREVKALQIGKGAVKFLKWLPERNAVFEEYARSDIFAYCSFFECGGYVVLEAMSCGVPVVSIQLGGPGEIVSNANGVLVTPGPIDQTVRLFAEAFASLARDRTLLMQKKKETSDAVGMVHSWGAKGDRLLSAMAKKCAPPSPK